MLQPRLRMEHHDRHHRHSYLSRGLMCKPKNEKRKEAYQCGTPLFLFVGYTSSESKLVPASQTLVKHIEDTVKQLHIVLVDNRKVLLDIHVRYVTTPDMV